jgi:hypothetical protein
MLDCDAPDFQTVVYRLTDDLGFNDNLNQGSILQNYISAKNFF